MTTCRAWIVLCGALLSAAGCAGGVKGPTRPTQAYAAPSVSAAQYQSDPPAGDALRGPHAVRVNEGILAAAAKHGVKLTPDSRLAELADLTANALDASGAPPSYPVLDFWARHLGLPEPTPLLLVLRQNDAAQLPQNIEGDVLRMLQRQRYTHYGAATFEREGSVLAVVALTSRWTTMQPVRREVAVGESVALSGNLLAEVRDPTLVISLPDGTSQRTPGSRGTRFSWPIPTTLRGEYRVELLADSSLGTTVVANFPLYVGVTAPRSIVFATPETGVLGPEEVNARLLALINADRQRAGVAPLANNAALASVALSHSTDMREHGFVGHTSPQTGSAADRMARAGIRTPLMLENIGRSYSPEDIHRGLMDSPGHRANVLHRDATHVGLGTVIEAEDGATAYLVTEVFARMAEKVDTEDAAEQLFSAINEERNRRGQKSLELVDSLAEECTKTARAFFQARPGSANQPLVAALSESAGRRPLPYTRLSALMLIVTKVQEAATLDAVLDTQARAIAIGIAQGTRDDTPQNAIAVVVLIAR